MKIFLVSLISSCFVAEGTLRRSFRFRIKKMAHIMIYCSFEKLHTGPVHVVTDSYQILYELNIPRTQKKMFYNAKDARFEITPIGLLDSLSKHGYTLASNSVMGSLSRNSMPKNYLFWTMMKKSF